MGKYDNIINMPHHVSKKHPQMSIEARAAQFAPFAALTGYDDEVRETARITDKRIEKGEELKEILDNKLQILKQHIKEKPKIIVTYFVPDLKKNGGKYVTVTESLVKIDEYNEMFVFENEATISIREIMNIEGEIFNSYL